MISGNGCVCNSSLIITLSSLWKEHLPPNNININVFSDVTPSIAQPMQLKPQHTYTKTTTEDSTSMPLVSEESLPSLCSHPPLSPFTDCQLAVYSAVKYECVTYM